MASAALLLFPSSLTSSLLCYSLRFLSLRFSSFLFHSLIFTLTSLIRSRLLLPSPASKLFLFVLYARDNEFQICGRCSWCAKVMLSIPSQSEGYSQYAEGRRLLNQVYCKAWLSTLLLSPSRSANSGALIYLLVTRNQISQWRSLLGTEEVGGRLLQRMDDQELELVELA